jgi:hypothetical protein
MTDARLLERQALILSLVMLRRIAACFLLMLSRA